MSRIASGERRVKYTFVECNKKVIHRGYSLRDDIHGHYAQQETIACMHDFTIEKYPFSFWRSVVEHSHFPRRPLT